MTEFREPNWVKYGPSDSESDWRSSREDEPEDGPDTGDIDLPEKEMGDGE